MAGAADIRAGGAAVEITATDQPLRQQLAASTGRLHRWVQENAGATVNVGSIGGEGIAGTLAAAGLGMRQLTGILRIGLDAVRGASAAIRGDWEGVDKAIREMPLGVGAVYGAVRDLRDELDGTAAAARGLAAAWEDFQTQAGGRATFAKGFADVQAKTKDLQAQTRKLLEEAATGQPDVLGQIRERAAKMRAEIEAEAKASGLGVAHPKVQAALAATEQWETAALRKETADANRRWLAAEDVKRKEAAAQVDKWAKDEADKRQRYIDTFVAEAERIREIREGLTASVATPEDQAKAAIAEAKKYFPAGGETYRRLVNQALEAAAAAMPEVLRTFSARGTFSGLEAALGMGDASAADRFSKAAQETADHTQKIQQILQRLQDEGIPLVWNP